MNMHTKQGRGSRGALALVAAALTFTAGASAAELDLSKPPLILNAAVDPNLLVTFDDSGSMAFGFTPDEIVDTSCSWRYKRYYSSAYNKQYYDPNIDYEPPLDANGTEFPAATFGAAPQDGFTTGSTTTNLGTNYFVSLDERGSTPKRITYNASATSKTSCSSTTYAFPTGSASAFYCTLKSASSDPLLDDSYDCKAVPAAERQNFANWFTYYRLRGYALQSATARAFGLLDDDVRVAWQNMNANQLAASTTIGKFAGTRRTNFFNFLYASPFSGNTPTLSSTIRAGDFFARAAKNTTSPYWDETLGSELSCRQNFHVLVSDGYWNQTNHPTSTGAEYSFRTSRSLPDGRSYSTSDAHSKFIWNEASRAYNCNPDGNKECSPSYTDLAFHYWYRDLRADLDDNVPPYLPDRTTGVTGAAQEIDEKKDLRTYPEIYWNPANDPASWQHVVQFFIGFGIAGKVPYSPASLEAIRKGTQQWPAAANNSPESVDDSWHATLASRGAYFSATNPNEVVDALVDILSNIVQRKGTASAVSVSTGIVTADTLGFQTQFDSTDWSGTVLARPVSSGLAFGKPTWDAACKLTGGDCATTGETGLVAPRWDTGRAILTSTAPSGTGRGAAFQWSDLSAAQQALLNRNPATGKVDSAGADRVAYLRGDRSKERKNGGAFRNRSSLFGAVVHSTAVPVGPPAEAYDDASWPPGSAEATAAAAKQGYEQFRAAHDKRARIVYVGANDGMLHALRAADGTELFGYVPWAAYRNLGKLTNPLYQFEPYVDNTPSVRDVYVGGKWRTVLVGTLRRGGQGAFALDITDPAAISEASAKDTVLWEFNGDAAVSGAPDLGYTYGVPFITRLATGNSGQGRWVVLLPAGYNAQEADGSVGSGNAVLFVLDVEDGSVLRKFDLGAIDPDAVGLASPQAIDLDGDETSDYAYAGDLAGHVWRFDFADTRPARWTVAKLFDPATVGERPITARPRVLLDDLSPAPRVFVGTGKFIERSDRSSAIKSQVFYGLLDKLAVKGGAGASPTALVDADLVARTTSTNAKGERQIGGPEPKPGESWKITFDEAAHKGERVIAQASLNVFDGRVIFTTLIPSGNDPCVPGGRGFLMVVKGNSGGASKDGLAMFDANGDGVIDKKDNADIVGKEIPQLIPGVASILPAGGGIGAIVLPPQGADDAPSTVRTREFEWRRRGWRDLQIRN
jgi:type IV pilus assembly protein PilY1